MKRVTILISDENDKIIRQAQAKMIKETNESYSYSKCLNELLGGKVKK